MRQIRAVLLPIRRQQPASTGFAQEFADEHAVVDDEPHRALTRAVVAVGGRVL